MKILLTNDDGIEAEGLMALAKACSAFSEVCVVAPDRHRSCCSHHVTVAEHLRVTQVDTQRFAVSGFPADCVRIALMAIKFQPDLVLSGINHGGNLGSDTIMSGTVAAAREARLLGIPAIAVSQYRKPAIRTDWNAAADRFLSRLPELMKTPPESESGIWNVNLPALGEEDGEPDWQQCPLEQEPLVFNFQETETGWEYQSNYQSRPRNPGSDVDVCFRGNVTMTWLDVFPNANTP